MSAKSRRTYKGAAVEAVLDAGGVSSATQTSITLSTSPSTWPTGKFFIVVAPGTAQEEKMCVTLSGSVLTTVDPNSASTAASTNGRGVDDTTARTTIAGGSRVYPVATAQDFDEANELTSTYANRGGIVYQGETTFAQLAIGTAGQVLKVNSAANTPEWGQVGEVGIADSAVTSAKIADGTIVNADINASAAIALSKLATGALPTGITVASANIVNGTITLEDLASAVQNFLVPVGTITAYAGTTAPTGWLICDGTSTSGYTTLAALVGATTPDLRGHTLVGKGAAPFDGALFSKLGSTTSTAAHTHSITHDHATFDTTGGEGAHGHTGTVHAVGDHTHPIATDTLTDVSTHGHGLGGEVMGGSGSNPDGNGTAYTSGAGGHGHSLTVDSNGAHNHSINIPEHVGTSGPSSVGSTHGNVQPSALVNYIIKHD